MVDQGLVDFAKVIKGMTWAEMARVSEHIVGEYQQLIKSDRLDRDGVAQSLVEMAKDIEKEINNLEPNQ